MTSSYVWVFDVRAHICFLPMQQHDRDPFIYTTPSDKPYKVIVWIFYFSSFFILSRRWLLSNEFSAVFANVIHTLLNNFHIRICVYMAHVTFFILYYFMSVCISMCICMCMCVSEASSNRNIAYYIKIHRFLWGWHINECQIFWSLFLLSSNFLSMILKIMPSG